MQVTRVSKPLVTFEDVGDNALIFEEHHIVIAFPQKDVHLDGLITIVNKD